MRARELYLIGCLLAAAGCNKKTGNDSQENAQPTAEPDQPENPESPQPAAGKIIISATLPAGTTSTHLAAIPVQGGQVDAQAVTNINSQPIEAGNVALTIESAAMQLLEGGQDGDNEQSSGDVSHVVIAYTDNADRFEAGDSFKFVTVPVGNAEALNLYTNELQTNTIDLGNVSENGDTFTAENPIKDGDFAIATAVLEELAATDDALRSIKNAYMNTNPDTGETVELRPYFQWTQSLDGAIDSFTGADAAVYFGYGFYFDTNRKDMTLDVICNDGAANHKPMKLAPPSPIILGSHNDPGAQDGTEVTELNSSGVGEVKNALDTRLECGGGTFYAHGDSKYPGVGWNWGGIKGPIAKGYWDLFFGTEKAARFDLAAIYPFGADQKPVIYLPSFKITTSGTKITKVEVKLYRYIGGVLTEITDLTAFRRVANWFGMSFTSFSGTSQKEEYKTFDVPASGSVLTPDLATYEMNWHISDTAVPEGSRVEAFAFQYNLYGSDYRFELRPGQK